MTSEAQSTPDAQPTPDTQMSKGTIRVLQLYPREMNIYGDWGNALVLKQRIKWHGYTPELLEYNVGDEFPDDVDIIVGGGGQDSGQLVIQNDLQARATLKGTGGRGRPHAGDLWALPAFRQVLQDQHRPCHSRHRHP
jgi:CobQ-like glutamine amidotransferase family enzyme